MCKNDGLRLGGTALLAVVLCAGVAAGRQPAPKASPKSRPQVEVVVCLDTTGSMDGLINAAKSKIWSICNQIAAGKPAPDLKIGLVPFRDHGDEYITKIYDLTDNLDAVHKNLMSFEAKGGGDIPEAVNQA